MDRIQLHHAILGVEKAIQLTAAGLHPARHLGLGEAGLLHRLLDLKRQHPLERSRSGLLELPFLFQQVFER
jgi:hypothetical protein